MVNDEVQFGMPTEEINSLPLETHGLDGEILHAISRSDWVRSDQGVHNEFFQDLTHQDPEFAAQYQGADVEEAIAERKQKYDDPKTGKTIARPQFPEIQRNIAQAEQMLAIHKEAARRFLIWSVGDGRRALTSREFEGEVYRYTGLCLYTDLIGTEAGDQPLKPIDLSLLESVYTRRAIQLEGDYPEKPELAQDARERADVYKTRRLLRVAQEEEAEDGDTLNFTRKSIRVHSAEQKAEYFGGKRSKRIKPANPSREPGGKKGVIGHYVDRIMGR